MQRTHSDGLASSDAPPAVAVEDLWHALGDTTPVLLGIAYEIAIALVMIYLTVRLFESDLLVTGNAGRVGKLLDSLQK